MHSISLLQLLDGIVRVSPSHDVFITGLALDSRLVKPGDLFLAYRGTSSDGRLFINQSIANGAKYVLAEKDSAFPTSYVEAGVPVVVVERLSQKVSEIAARFYGHPGEAQTIIGITGTNGKTSCSHFIAAMLQDLHKPCGVIGTLGSGVYGNMKPSNLTTPDPITLQHMLASFLAEGVRYVAMEVSSHSLDQGRVNHIPFKVGIFTNLTRDHLDYHGTMEAYGNAKAKLFAFQTMDTAVINADDVFGLHLLQSLQSVRKSLKMYAYTVQPSTIEVGVPCVSTTHVRRDAAGISANIVTPWGEGELRAKLMGDFNLSNLLAALTALCSQGIPLAQVLQAIASLTPVPGRMQSFGGDKKPVVVVDYSHTPDALEKALSALRKHCQGKLYCVFGCGGDRDKGKRPIMASIAERLADVVYVTDDNPRTEDSASIVSNIMQGFSRPDQVIVQHDRSKAIRDVIQYAKMGDCILIAGKGAETYQQIGESKIPFSDIDQVKANL